MVDWVTIPAFANGDIVRAEVFQDIYSNLELLKNPPYIENQLTNDSGTWTTTGTTLADIDTTKLRLEFESFGGDLIAGITIVSSSNAVNGSVYISFELDGITYGNANGLARFQEQFTLCARQMIYVFEGIEAGTHTLDVQYAASSGTAELYEDTCNKLWVLEL